MNNKIQKLELLEEKLEEIIGRLKEFENKYEIEINEVDQLYTNSAKNLIHYLAFRSFDIVLIQEQLSDLSLPSLSNIEPHVMKSLVDIKHIIKKLNDKEIYNNEKGIISIKKSRKLLNKNTKLLFGRKSKKRRTRIMVTLPNTAADDYKFVHKLIKSGMNCARINCAHDNEEIWLKMINNVKDASKKLNKKCKILMDLGGPKLRTGAMVHGAQVIHIKPQRDEYGKVFAHTFSYSSLLVLMCIT